MNSYNLKSMVKLDINSTNIIKKIIIKKLKKVAEVTWMCCRYGSSSHENI